MVSPFAGGLVYTGLITTGDSRCDWCTCWHPWWWSRLVLLIEEDGKRILLTGDMQHDVLLGQLEEAGLIEHVGLHLDILKVQHHGSENNMSPDFARTVTADYYIFRGDGKSGNPEPEVIEQVYASRMSNDPAVRGRAPLAAGERPFHFWFGTSTATSSRESGAENFQEMAALVERLKE